MHTGSPKCTVTSPSDSWKGALLLIHSTTTPGRLTPHRAPAQLTVDSPASCLELLSLSERVTATAAPWRPPTTATKRSLRLHPRRDQTGRSGAGHDAFAKTDQTDRRHLLKRSSSTAMSGQAAAHPGSSHTQNSGHKVRRPRAARACNLCRLKKNKCDELYPCTYCRSMPFLCCLCLRALLQAMHSRELI